MKREPLVLAFALIFPSFMAWLYFVVVSESSTTGAPPNLSMQILYAVGKVVQFGLPVLWVWRTDRGALRTLFAIERPETPPADAGRNSGNSPYGIRLGLWFGIAVAAIVLVIYMATRRDDVLQPSDLFFGVPARLRAKLNQLGLMTPWRYVELGVFLAVINSGLEEYYWRWFVFGRLKRYLPVAAAIVVSSLGFMGHHVIVLGVYFPGRFWEAVVPFSLAIALGGAVWAWIYHKSGSLAGSWISHFIVDVAVMAFGYDLAFRQ
jgi:membrane protease YdiL (CAAX protease family)